ncbi:C2 domain protein [Quillaja saponaria]|uniref:C2 domain protein n=1 Tax=Quillaja saponaria TaxID=32244 RepID=A0AAD7M4P4_QUISA|nr:C2 domain protein [Quillaja saponaria]
MASGYEVELKISSAKDIKNVNWRYGPNRPYAVVWVDPKNKCSTKVDEIGDTCPNWDETLVIPLPSGPIEDFTLYMDIVHAGSEEDTKPLIGSARLKLSEVLDDVGIGESANRSLKLKRPSGRPHGKVEVKVTIRQTGYRARDSYYAPPYGVPPPATREYQAPPAYGTPYGAPPPTYDPYYSAAPPAGYPYSAYNAQPPPPQQPQPYGQTSYGYGQGQPLYGQEEKKKSKFGGMGTGLAVGAVAGVLGGLAIAEGADYVEDKIADDVADKVEDDLGYDGDDF